MNLLFQTSRMIVRMTQHGILGEICSETKTDKSGFECLRPLVW